MNKQPMRAWDVYLYGRLINTVYFDADMAADQVKHSLIDHDGFNPAIVVRKG